MFHPQSERKPKVQQPSPARERSAAAQDTSALQLRAGILQLQKQYGNQRTMQMLSAYRLRQQRPMQLKKGETEMTTEPQPPAALYRVRKKGAVRIKLKKVDDKQAFHDANAKIDQVIIGAERPRGIFGDHHGSHTTAWEVFCDVVRFSITGKTVDEAIATLQKLCSSDLTSLPGLPTIPHLNGEEMAEEEEHEDGGTTVEEDHTEEELPLETVNVEADVQPSASGTIAETEEEEEVEDEGVEQWTYDDFDAEYEPEYLEEEDEAYLESLNPAKEEEADNSSTQPSNLGMEEEQPAQKPKPSSSQNPLKRSREDELQEEEPKKLKLTNPEEEAQRDKAAEHQFQMGNYLKAYRRLESSIGQAEHAKTLEEASGLEKIGVLQELVLAFLQFRNSLPLSAFDSAVNNGKNEGKLINDIRKYENYQEDVSAIKKADLNALRDKMWLLLDQAAVEEFYEVCKEEKSANGKQQVAHIVKRHLITLNQAYSNVYGLTNIASQNSIVNFLTGKVKPIAKKGKEDPVTLHFDKKTATEIAKLVLYEQAPGKKKLVRSPQLEAKEFDKRDKIDEADLAPTKRFACQIELDEAEDPAITHIRFSGRAPGIFGNQTMGSHLTAWSLHAEVVKAKLRGKTLSEARDEISNLLDDSKTEGGYKRTEAIKAKKAYESPGDTTDDFPDKFQQQSDGMYNDILTRFKSAEDEVDKTLAALEEAKGAVLLPALQDAIAAYMHVRNTLLLSAVDGRNVGLRAVGRGEAAKVRDIRKVEQLVKQDEQHKATLEIALEEKMSSEEEASKERAQDNLQQHVMPDKQQVRNKMWELLDHDALNYFTRRKATAKTAPGILKGETQYDLISEVIESHLKALREAFPKAYDYAEMGSEASRQEFFEKLLVTHKEGVHEDSLSILHDVEQKVGELENGLGDLKGSEVAKLAVKYRNATPLLYSFLDKRATYEKVVEEVKNSRGTQVDNAEDEELRDYDVPGLVYRIFDFAFNLLDKIDQGSYSRLGEENQKLLKKTADEIRKEERLTRRSKIEKKIRAKKKKVISYNESSDSEEEEE